MLLLIATFYLVTSLLFYIQYDILNQPDTD